jgi:hypothetical protein
MSLRDMFCVMDATYMKTERTKKGKYKEGDALKGNGVPASVRSVQKSG